jgi:sugar-specific transcriptional regulator TrmB/O-methyltransferase involved in polyketide biosynthesis
MERILQEIGFTEKEAMTYLALLKIGAAPASKVARETGYERSSTYYLLIRMLEKGYVAEYILKGVRHFVVTSPSKLRDKIEEKKQILEESLDKLQKLHQATKEQVNVEVRIGKEGFNHLYRDAIKAGKEILGIGIDDSQYEEFDKWSLDRYYRDAKIKGIKERFITTEGTKTYGSEISEYRTIPEEFFQPTPTFIYGNNVVIIIWKPTPTLIFIESSELSDAYKKQFELLWKNAKSHNSKNMEGIKDTAFWIAACRAEEQEISKDNFAHLWINKESKLIHDKYIKQVSKDENIALSLRNRFFLEELKRFAKEHKNSTFINIGSGVSMYPYLINTNIRFCEVDCKEIIEFKKNKLEEFTRTKKIPNKQIKFYSADLNNKESISQLFSKLSIWTKGDPCFILIEGVSYYLRISNIKQVLTSCHKLQSKADLLGVVTWPKFLKNTEVFNRFENFVEKILGEELLDFTFLDKKEIQDMQKYKLKKHTNYLEISKIYGVSDRLSEKKEDLIYEELYILKK